MYLVYLTFLQLINVKKNRFLLVLFSEAEGEKNQNLKSSPTVEGRRFLILLPRVWEQ